MNSNLDTMIRFCVLYFGLKTEDIYDSWSLVWTWINPESQYTDYADIIFEITVRENSPIKMQVARFNKRGNLKLFDRNIYLNLKCIFCMGSLHPYAVKYSSVKFRTHIRPWHNSNLLLNSTKLWMRIILTWIERLKIYKWQFCDENDM